MSDSRSTCPQTVITRVGKFELGITLGEGNFAKVKLATNVRTGQQFAIKIFDKEKILKNKLVDQIKREISTMKLVKHLNIVQLHEVIASKTKVYFVLEYAAGGELFHSLARRGRLSEDQARKYFQQLINAVDYCHSRDVYHRDLKPQNLLLDANGNLKISDFGLSALPQQLRKDGLLHTACGTPNYVAPEVLMDRGYDGAKADLWSCGVILFMLMAGYLPFEDANLMQLYRKIQRAEYAYPTWFSSGARKLITRILNPNPKLRITIPKILESRWFKEGYKPEKYEVDEDNINLDDVDAVFNQSKEYFVTEKEPKVPKPTLLNAFELISLSRGLNLSGLFQNKKDVKHETHFTSKHPAPEIISKMEETAKPLGFSVEKHDYKMKLQGSVTGRKGHVSVATEVFEVAPSLFVVEVRKAGGDTLEYVKFYQNFSTGLKDIVWKTDEDFS